MKVAVVLFGRSLGEVLLLESDSKWGLIGGEGMEAEVDTHAARRLILKQTGLDIPIAPNDYRASHLMPRVGGGEQLVRVFGLVTMDDRSKKGAWFPTHRLPRLELTVTNVIQAALTHFCNKK